MQTMDKWRVEVECKYLQGEKFYLENKLQAFVKAGRLLSENEIEAVDIYKPYDQFYCTLSKEV
jgi:hypothetical protein